ncbi:MAG: hypothetical protein QM731_23640 [Chitinophagaceae bacterium]
MLLTASGPPACNRSGNTLLHPDNYFCILLLSAIQAYKECTLRHS